MPGKLYGAAVFGWLVLMGSAYAAGKSKSNVPPDYLDHYLGTYEVTKNSKDSPRKFGHFFREDVIHESNHRGYSLYQLSLHNLEPNAPGYKEMIDLLLIRDDRGRFFKTRYANGHLHKTQDGKFFRIPKDFVRVPDEELNRLLIPYALRRGKILIREPELSSILVKLSRHDQLEVRLREYSATPYLIPSVRTDRYTLKLISGDEVRDHEPEVSAADWRDSGADARD